MSGGQKFEELNKAKHDRNTFDCGETELNSFIKTQALKHMSTSKNPDPRRLGRQVISCDPQIHEVFRGSRKRLSCQPTEAWGF